eukprot:7063956-Prymnesium_polylepis.1
MPSATPSPPPPTGHAETGARVDTAERLSSSTTSGTKVDVVITSFELSPPRHRHRRHRLLPLPPLLPPHRLHLR